MHETGFGDLLRTWRDRRGLTQLELSLRAGVSTRHLSFLENGRSNPSREMVVDLGQHLDLPLRERNVLLAAAGYAPVYHRTPLDAPEMEAVRSAIDRVLAAHEPYPTLAVDRYWNIVAMNAAAALFAQDIAPALLGPPANVYRLSLHPDGLAPRVVNFAELAYDLLGRLRHDVAVSADPELAALLEELEAYPTVRELAPAAAPHGNAVVVPVRLRHPWGELSLFTTITTFGTPVDVTVDELAIETFFPADAATTRRLHDLASAGARAVSTSATGTVPAAAGSHP